MLDNLPRAIAYRDGRWETSQGNPCCWHTLIRIFIDIVLNTSCFPSKEKHLQLFISQLEKWQSYKKHFIFGINHNFPIDHINRYTLIFRRNTKTRMEFSAIKETFFLMNTKKPILLASVLINSHTSNSPFVLYIHTYMYNLTFEEKCTVFKVLHSSK